MTSQARFRHHCVPVEREIASTRRSAAEPIPAATNRNVGRRAAERNAAWLAAGRSPA